MALINLGWIMFRANSTTTAREMLSAVASPAAYGSHVLSGSLYLLVASVAAGYGIVLFVIDALDRHSVDPQTSDQQSDLVALAARWRWYWIPPLYAIALIFLLIVTLTHAASTAQFMYNKF
jgi:hypothetical protein